MSFGVPHTCNIEDCSQPEELLVTLLEAIVTTVPSSAGMLVMGETGQLRKQGGWEKFQDLLSTLAMNITALFRKCVFLKVHTSHGNCLVTVAESVHSRKGPFFALGGNLPPGDRLLDTRQGQSPDSVTVSAHLGHSLAAFPCKNRDGPRISNLPLLFPLCYSHYDVTAAGTVLQGQKQPPGQKKRTRLLL